MVPGVEGKPRGAERIYRQVLLLRRRSKYQDVTDQFSNALMHSAAAIAILLLLMQVASSLTLHITTDLGK
jgi:hypothetical protein